MCVYKRMHTHLTSALCCFGVAGWGVHKIRKKCAGSANTPPFSYTIFGFFFFFLCPPDKAFPCFNFTVYFVFSHKNLGESPLVCVREKTILGGVGGYSGDAPRVSALIPSFQKKRGGKPPRCSVCSMSKPNSRILRKLLQRKKTLGGG